MTDVHKLALELLIPQILHELEQASPGSKERIIEKVVVDASSELEKTDDETLKAAFFHLADLAQTRTLFDRTRGELIATAMRLSCYMDELEHLAPGASERANAKALERMEGIAATYSAPHHDAAVQDLKDHIEAVRVERSKRPNPA